MIEFNIAVILIILPLVLGGASWFWISFERISCAHRAFSRARHQLIQTHQPVTYHTRCGGIEESVRLVPLEALDQDKGALDFGDLITEGSELWEALSLSWPL